MDKINKMQSKNMNNLIAVLAVVIVVVALANIYITFTRVSDFNEKLTGYAIGYVNISVASNIQINLTNSSINFGGGAVNADCSRAVLYTNGKSPPTIICGNWSSTNAGHGIVIENIGNINCTLTANSSSGSSPAATFIGGTSPVYQWNITASEAGSCSGNRSALNNWDTANTTAFTICTDFSYIDAGDEVTLDVNFSIPADAITGARSDIITITAATQG